MSVIERDPDENEGWQTVGSGMSDPPPLDEGPLAPLYWKQRYEALAEQHRGAVSLLCDLVDALDNVTNPGDAGEPYDRALEFVAQHRGGQ